MTNHLKNDGAALTASVLLQSDVELVVWEHKVLRSLIAHLPDAPVAPPVWPDGRSDVLWVFERNGHGWSFAQYPQLLLAGDSELPIV